MFLTETSDEGSVLQLTALKQLDSLIYHGPMCGTPATIHLSQVGRESLSWPFFSVYDTVLSMHHASVALCLQQICHAGSAMVHIRCQNRVLGPP